MTCNHYHTVVGLALLLSIAPLAAQADSLQGPSFVLDQVWAVEAGDWNGDGATDAAMILAPSNEQEDAGLVLYLSDRETTRLQLSAWHPNLLWGNRELFGQEPRLVLDDYGRLVAVTQNSAIGRGRWEQTITMSWGDGWQVDGFSYDHYDTLDLAHQGRCDLNYLSQTGKILSGEALEQQTFELAAVPAPRLEDWRAVDALGTCGLLGD